MKGRASAGALLAAGCLLAGARAQDPPDLPATYALRAEGRARLQDKRVARAIEHGLVWLREHQDENGRWDADGFGEHDRRGEPCDGPGNPVHDVGVTGLALLAFLGDGAGLRPDSDRDVVERGLAWLARQQDEKTGRVGPKHHTFVYGHAIAATALCEGYGLLGGEGRRTTAQRAIDYLERHRNPKMVWRYDPGGGDNDTSITTWCVTAYVTAADFGLLIETAALRHAAAWYDRVTDPPTGSAGYTKAGEPSSRHPGDHGKDFPTEEGAALTASALYGRHLLGQRAHTEPVLFRARETIGSRPARWDGGAADFYYWYHGACALHAIDPGARWLSELRAMLLAHQRTDGNHAGSWDPIGAWGEDGGRVYSTALAVLSLQAPYRFGERLAPSPFPALAAFDAARAHWRDGAYAAAARELERLAPEGFTEPERAALEIARRALGELLADATREVESLGQGPDFVASKAKLEAMAKSYRGLPPGDAARDELDRFAKDRRIKNEIRASQELEKLTRRHRKSKRERYIEALERFHDRFGGTLAGRRAKRELKRLGADK